MKFGGTSVADLDRIRNVARHVRREVNAGYQVAVVVSAMSGETNKLVGYCRSAAVLHDAREYDAVVTAGEQVTAGLLAIVLQEIGINARSWMGWQIPISTDSTHGSARITDIRADKLLERLDQGQVAVVAGFQGLAPDNRIATLGRGGSDTSAVAIAAAIGAERCDIYTDVDGVYTTDPRIVPAARRLEKVAFEEMLEMASLGSKVLQVRSVELAMVHGVRTFVRSSFDDPEAPQGGADNQPVGTLICDEDEIVEKQLVTGIAYSKDEAKITLRGVEDKPGVAAAIFKPLAQAGVNVDMIVQSKSGRATDLTFTVPTADFERATALIEGLRAGTVKMDSVSGSTDIAKISVVGIGMRSHTGVAADAFAALASRGINIQLITTSEIKISVLIDAAYTELAVRTLHSAYELDKT
jgi:aspartate kinase